MQPNTNWYQPQQAHTGILAQLGSHLPQLGSLAAVLAAPEASLPALALRGAVGGAAGSLFGGAMGGQTPGVLNSAIQGGTTGGELSLLSNTGKNAALQPVLDSLGNNTTKIARSGLADVTGTLEKMGLKATPENMQQASQLATKYYDAAISSALDQAGPVDLNGVLGKYRFDMLNPHTEAEKTLAQVMQRNGLTNYSAGFNPLEGLNGSDVRKILGDLGKEKEALRPTPSIISGTVDPGARRTYNDLTDVHSAIKRELYSRPEVTQSLSNWASNITPEALQDAESYGSPEIGRTLSAGFQQQPEVAKYIASTLQGAGAGDQELYQDVLDDYSRFINMDKLGSGGLQVKNNVYPFKPPATHNPFSNNGVLGLLALNLMNRGKE